MEKGNKGRTAYFSEVVLGSDVPVGALIDVKMESVADGHIQGVAA
jgi:hypothetical protein